MKKNNNNNKIKPLFGAPSLARGLTDVKEKNAS